MKIVHTTGLDYEFDQQAVTIDEWRSLKRMYKMTPGLFQNAVDEADPDASTFLYWVMLRQNQKDMGVPLSDNLKPDIVKLNNAFAEAVQAESAAAQENPEPDSYAGRFPPGWDQPRPPQRRIAAVTSAASGNGSSSATSTSSGASTSSSSPATATSPPGTSDD